MQHRRHTEQGQVLVLLTLGIITLLGFTALAIDGGRLYGERRTIQGVADTSSMTGALYLAHYDGTITSTVVEAAKNSALQRAQSNGYDGTMTTVTITQNGSYYYVKTVINTAIDPVIAQLIYNGPLNVGASTVARVMIMPVFAHGHALYSLSGNQKNAMEFTGNGDIKILGTGIYSNSTHGTDSMSFGGSSVSVFTHAISAAGGIDFDATVLNPDGTPFTNYTADVPQLDMPPVPTPSCAGLPAGTRTDTGDDVYFTPGVFAGITENGHDEYHFADGFYCINGAFTTANGEFEGDDVTFYVSTGNVSLSGEVDFRAPSNGSAVDGAGQKWDGMLLYIATGKLTINGNAESYYEGTVYVPTPANPSCKLNGSSDSEGFQMQLVCDSINLNGDGNLVINYDATKLYVPPVNIDLVQ